MGIHTCSNFTTSNSSWSVLSDFRAEECDGKTEHWSVRVDHHKDETECLEHQSGHFCALGAISGDRSKCECRPTHLNGQWGSYGNWGQCSTTCGAGRRTRTRACDNPAPRWGGKDCEGSANEVGTCNENVPCPVHGIWGSYSAWGSCSAL